MNRIAVYILFFIPFLLKAQFAPCVGLPSTTAIAKDSTVFKSWASDCKSILGWVDIANHSLGKTTIGTDVSAVGKAGLNGVLSLGDGGEAILTFDYPISNGLGPDFAVFENGFNNTFLELAFVEVSSDGVRYIRFPATSLSDTSVQLDNNAVMDATKINNLAGKYKANYGTPFDLEELKDSIGLNLKAITHVKIIDVVGSINPVYGKRDAKHHLINDPYPTPYPSAGFDLDAIGVIYSETLGLEEATINISIFPNPSQGVFTINVFGENRVEVYTLIGEKIVDQNFIDTTQVDLTALPKGMYSMVVNGVNKKVFIE